MGLRTIGFGGPRQGGAPSVPLPTGLTLTLISGGVRVDFTDNSGGTAQHEIWAQSDGGISALLTTLAAADVSYDDTVSPVDLRYYKVRAKDGSKYSAFTAEVSIAMLSAELMVNGGFDSDVSWAKGAGWTIHDGRAYFLGSAWSGLAQNNGIQSSAKTYRVIIDVYDLSVPSMIFNGGGNTPALSPTNGHYVWIGHPNNNGVTVQLVLTADGSASFDNYSIKEVLFP